jgi:hypothetical protein
MLGRIATQTSVRIGPLAYFKGFADEKKTIPVWTTDRNEAPLFTPMQAVEINGHLPDVNLWHMLSNDELPNTTPPPITTAQIP